MIMVSSVTKIFVKWTFVKSGTIFFSGENSHNTTGGNPKCQNITMKNRSAKIALKFRFFIPR